MGGGGGGLFGLNCECVACLPERPAKRGRRPWPRPAAQILATAPGEAEPLFLLERLAHIRCLALTLAPPSADRRITRATVEIHNSVLTARCDVATDAGPALALALRVDVGEALAPAGGEMQLADGYAYARLPLAPAADDPEELRVAASEEMRLREEAGVRRRAAAQRRRERAALQGAWLRCAACDAAVVQLPDRLASAPHPDADQLVDFVQCCQELSFDWRCVFPAVEADDDDPAQAALRLAARPVGGGFEGDDNPAAGHFPPPRRRPRRACWRTTRCCSPPRRRRRSPPSPTRPSSCPRARRASARARRPRGRRCAATAAIWLGLRRWRARRRRQSVRRRRCALTRRARRAATCSS